MLRAWLGLGLRVRVSHSEPPQSVLEFEDRAARRARARARVRVRVKVKVRVRVRPQTLCTPAQCPAPPIRCMVRVTGVGYMGIIRVSMAGHMATVGATSMSGARHAKGVVRGRGGVSVGITIRNVAGSYLGHHGSNPNPNPNPNPT